MLGESSDDAQSLSLLAAPLASKGGELALLLASIYKQIKKVVAID